MKYEDTYTHPTEQPIKVAYPSDDGCPFIPQSNYTFGSRARIEMCSSINHAVYEVYCTLTGAQPSTYPYASGHAFDLASDLMDGLLIAIGYKHTAREEVF